MRVEKERSTRKEVEVCAAVALTACCSSGRGVSAMGTASGKYSVVTKSARQPQPEDEEVAEEEAETEEEDEEDAEEAMAEESSALEGVGPFELAAEGGEEERGEGEEGGVMNASVREAETAGEEMREEEEGAVTSERDTVEAEAEAEGRESVSRGEAGEGGEESAERAAAAAGGSSRTRLRTVWAERVILFFVRTAKLTTN